MTTLDAEKIRMPFGHYRGVLLGELAAEDPLYLAHMASEGVRDDYLAKALRVLADKHRETIAAKIAKGEKPKLLAHLAGAGQRPQGKQLKLF